MVEVMNSIGYDAMALDNHEFDQGLTTLSGMIQAANFDVLSANTEWPGTPQTADYSIEEIAGYQIGIIGLTPSFWYAPDGVVFTDLAESASIAVSELEAQGVNFIIILGCVWSGLANSVPGVDLWVHTDLHWAFSTSLSTSHKAPSKRTLSPVTNLAQHWSQIQRLKP
jgi:5'-nucleotidase